MKHRLFFTLLVLLLPNISYASLLYSGVIGDYCYSLYNNYGIFCATIKKAHENYSGSLIIPSSVTYENFTFSVTSIDEFSFRNCTNITSVTIPNSVTGIGGSAFSNCTSLTSVTIPNSVTGIGGSAFSNCTSLTSVTIPNSVTSIGYSVFSGCISLASIIIPYGVTEIRNGAFRGCSSLTSVEIPNSVQELGAAFTDCVNLTSINIPYGVTKISGFGGCTALSSITLPNSVTSIGDQTFASCSSLTSIEIPSSVTYIGGECFRGCSNLTSIEIPNVCTSIATGNSWGSVFEDCTSLSSVKLSNNVTSIVYRMFLGCTSLSTIEIPDEVTTISTSAFEGCCSLSSIQIPNSVRNIGYSIFKDCSNLSSVILSNNLKSISDYMFYGCSSLTTIDIPNNVTSIGEYAFSNCTGLEYLVLSDSVKSIGSSAFYGCSNLTICVPASAEIGSSAFSGCKKVIYYTDRIGDYWFNDTCLVGYTGTETELELPYTHNGQTYTVAASAFEKLNTPITSISIPRAVTSIGNYAFRNVRTLKKVELPVNLTVIATNTFYNCDSIESVSMGLHENTPSIKTLFGSSINKSLKEFIALEGSTLVGTKKGGNNYQMFTNNRVIETIKIPYTVEIIADSTFMNCYNLKSITIGYKTVAEGEPENSPHRIKRHLLAEDNDTLHIYKVRIGDCEFQNDTNVTVLILEDGVEEIGYKAFENCRKLTNIKVPNTVLSIGAQAFNKCARLTDVTLGCDFQALKKSGGSPGMQFAECKNIKNIKLLQRRKTELGTMQPLTTVFASSLNSIETLEWLNGSDTICWTNATDTARMEDIPMLQSVYIPDNVTGIGNGAFKGATLLTEIDLPSSLHYIGAGAFMRTGIKGTFKLPKDVNTIGSCVLAKCHNLRWLQIGCVNMTAIPNYFCGGCENLEKVDYLYYGRPENKCHPKTIEQAAFADCSSLRKITVPSSVEEIQGQAFSNCTKVNDLRVEAVTPPVCRSIPGNPFYGVRRNHTLVVPEGTETSYASSVYVWNEFQNVLAFRQQKETLQSAETTTETTPNSVNVSWAEYNNAGAYDLDISENGTDEGHSFTVASYQAGNNPSPARRAKMEGGIPGITFSLTGLKPNTEYTYSIIAFDANRDTLSVETGAFRTQEETPVPVPEVPTTADLTAAGYNVANNVVLCMQFTGDATICYDIVLAGTYNNWNTTPASMLHMQPLAGFDGWYAAEFPYQVGTDNNGNPVLPQAKPIQLKSDGTVSWDYQCGDVNAWTHKGEKQAYVVNGFDNEADIYYPEAGAYIYELSYWKNHNTPCVIVPKHYYTINLYAPSACEEMKPAIIGGFNNWSENVAMTAQTDTQNKTYYTSTVYTEEGTEFKFREVNDNTWTNQIQMYVEEYGKWFDLSNLVLPVTTEDKTLTYDFLDNTKYRFGLCNNVSTGIDNTSAGTDAPQKVLIDGVLYILRDGKVYTIQGQLVK